MLCLIRRFACSGFGHYFTCDSLTMRYSNRIFGEIARATAEKRWRKSPRNLRQVHFHKHDFRFILHHIQQPVMIRTFINKLSAEGLGNVSGNLKTKRKVLIFLLQINETALILILLFLTLSLIKHLRVQSHKCTNATNALKSFYFEFKENLHKISQFFQNVSLKIFI